MKTQFKIGDIVEFIQDPSLKGKKGVVLEYYALEVYKVCCFSEKQLGFIHASQMKFIA